MLYWYWVIDIKIVEFQVKAAGSSLLICDGVFSTHRVFRVMLKGLSNCFCIAWVNFEVSYLQFLFGIIEMF